jgi:hypothetical protein
MADDYEEPNMVSAPNIGRMDDNMFHQIQKLFGSLKFTDRKYYNPKEYCHSYKDWDNQPVNVREQQDAKEYLDRFLEKIENKVELTPFKNMVKDIFNGSKV